MNRLTDKKDSYTLYLKISGFYFKIVFYYSDFPIVRKKVIHQINKYLSGFIEKRLPDKIDYQIDFFDIKNTFVFMQKKDYKFLVFYKKISANRIITFYYISLSQFLIIIRLALNSLLNNEIGFTLHASSVLIKDKAFVFVGPPGAGKSTIMKKLSKEFIPLADDSIILKKESRRYYLYQTPFLEKEHKFIHRTKKRFVIDKFFFLKKSKIFSVKKILNKIDIFNLLFNQILDTEYSEKKIRYIYEFIKYNKDKFYYLYFKKEDLVEFFKEEFVY